MIKNYSQVVLDAYGLTADFDKIVESIASDENRKSDLDESKLSDKAQKVANINQVTFEKFLPPLFLKQVEALSNRTPEEMISYEQFVNCVLLPKSSSEGELPFLALNLMSKFSNAFSLLKSKMSSIISDLHVGLAQATSVNAVKDTTFMAKFANEVYSADIANCSKIFEEANKW